MVNLAENNVTLTERDHVILAAPKYYKHISYHLLQYNWTTYILSTVDLEEDNVTINETEPDILVAPK